MKAGGEVDGEEDHGHISLITPSEATPTDTTVTPTVDTIPPATSSVTPQDFTLEPFTATIQPSEFDSPGIDPSGILRFPIPPGTSEPTGMTGVAFARTVLGSMEGSDHVFRLESEAIISPPPDDTRPTCKLISRSSSQVILEVEDNGSGLKEIRISNVQNATVVVDLTPGTTDPVRVTATKNDPSMRARFRLEAEDMAGNIGFCTSTGTISF